MAIIDKNLVFTDGPVLASGVSDTVALTGLSLPGRMEPMPLRVCVTQSYDPDAVANLAITLQQADSNTPDADAWSDVPGASLSLSGQALLQGTRLPWRFLPEGVTRPWLRFRYAVTAQAGKTPAAGALFAAIMREEDFPYVAAQQVK